MLREALSEGELSSLLAHLSVSRTRKFLRRFEDECFRLVAARKATRGRIRTMTTCPLSEKLRELVCITARRFLIKDATLPEGDVEKPMSLTATRRSRIPTLLYLDFVPEVCPLVCFARHGARGGQGVVAGATAAAAGSSQGHEARDAGAAGAVGAASAAGERYGACSGATLTGAGSNGRPAMGVYRPGRMVEARQAAAEDSMDSAGKGAKGDGVDRGGGKGALGRGAGGGRGEGGGARARPAMGVYRPGRMVEARQAAAEDAMDAEGGVMERERGGEKREEGEEEEEEGEEEAEEEEMEEEEGEAELEAMHDYADYRLDLTPRTWGQERRQPFVELEGGVWRGDEAWMLRGEGGNGTVTFCVQQERAGGGGVVVGLSIGRPGRGGQGCTWRVTVWAVPRRAEVRRFGPRGEVVGCASSELPISGPAPEGAGRPPPEKFWVLVRGGLVAVGSGVHCGVSGVLAVLDGDAPPGGGVKHVSFGQEAAAAPVTVYRIAVGGRVCACLAGYGHLELASGDFAVESKWHARLMASPPTRWAPPRGLARWSNLPSAVTWVVGRAKEWGGPAGRAAVLRGWRVVASSKGWGWVVMRSERDQGGAGEAAGGEWACVKGAGDSRVAAWCPRGGIHEPFGDVRGVERLFETLPLCAGRRELEESGIAVTRERHAASSAAVGRLIMSALGGPPPGKRARGGRGGVVRGVERSAIGDLRSAIRDL